MNLTEFKDKFLDIEENHNLFSFHVEGFEYWQYIRVRVFYELQDKLFSFKKGENKWQRISTIHKVKTVLYSVFVSIFKNPLIKFKKKDILIFTGSRRIKKQGKDFDIYFDELINQTDKSVNVLEDYFQGNDYNSLYYDKVAYIDFLYIFQKIILKLKKIDKIYLDELISTLSIFEKEFNVKINDIKIYKFFINHLIEHLYFRKIYRKIILKASPKIILQTVSYGTWKQIFNEEARKLKIPVIELQHGFMGAYQIPYNFKNNRKISSFPDYIFTFGEFWNHTTHFPIEKNQIISCGFPHFENNRNILQKIDTDKFTILFISQPTIANELIAIALELTDILSENEYEIIYKLHPQEYSIKSEMYQKLHQDNRIKVTDKNSPDLYHYFNIANAQVGVYSTAIIEGLGFNLQTFIAKLYGHEWMEDLYTNEYAHLINSAGEIADNLQTTAISNHKIGLFWKENAMKNILNEINKFF